MTAISETARDTLFADADAPVTDFVFDERVARVFDDMIGRSVPCYADLVRLIGMLARRFLPPGACCVDLGCSLGAVSESILTQCPAPGPRVIAVDRSAAMIDALRARLAVWIEVGRLETRHADVATVALPPAHLLVLNLTLQFIPLDQRDRLLKRMRGGLMPGGALILTEKIRWERDATDALMREAHECFKRANGYSELEISRKRAALEQVLRPETAACHEARLDAAGFARIERWFQCLNFVSWLAWT